MEKVTIQIFNISCIQWNGKLNWQPSNMKDTHWEVVLLSENETRTKKIFQQYFVYQLETVSKNIVGRNKQRIAPYDGCNPTYLPSSIFTGTHQNSAMSVMRFIGKIILIQLFIVAVGAIIFIQFCIPLTVAIMQLIFDNNDDKCEENILIHHAESVAYLVLSAIMLILTCIVLISICCCRDRIVPICIGICGAIPLYPISIHLFSIWNNYTCNQSNISRSIWWLLLIYIIQFSILLFILVTIALVFVKNIIKDQMEPNGYMQISQNTLLQNEIQNEFYTTDVEITDDKLTEDTDREMNETD